MGVCSALPGEGTPGPEGLRCEPAVRPQQPGPFSLTHLWPQEIDLE